MPINATTEYFRAEKRFMSAKTREEKISALEEMIRELPKHKGSENLLAQLKGRLAKLKREREKKGVRKSGITKEGYAQVCIIGPTNTGKSTLLKKITGAEPEIEEHPFTTIEPQVGMMDYKGIKIQIVEIPALFKPEHMSIVRTCDAVVITGSVNEMYKLLIDFGIDKKTLPVNISENPESIKEKIWRMLDMIIAYSKDEKTLSPIALPKNSTIRNFAECIHKDFIKNFRFARLWRNGLIKQVGLEYELENNDVIEIFLK